jgi:hypothetical protein
MNARFFRWTALAGLIGFGSGGLAASSAEAVTLYLNNVTFADGGTATGYFEYSGSWPVGTLITTSDYSSPQGTFGTTYRTGNFSGVMGSAFSSGFQTYMTVTIAPGLVAEQLNLLVASNFNPAAQNPLLTSPLPQFNVLGSYEDLIYGGTDHLRYIVSGSIGPAVTPLPAALPLFASGLGIAALLRWHRKRRTTSASST